jgi:hypothetical protein
VCPHSVNLSLRIQRSSLPRGGQHRVISWLIIFPSLLEPWQRDKAENDQEALGRPWGGEGGWRQEREVFPAAKAGLPGPKSGSHSGRPRCPAGRRTEWTQMNEPKPQLFRLFQPRAPLERGVLSVTSDPHKPLPSDPPQLPAPLLTPLLASPSSPFPHPKVRTTPGATVQLVSAAKCPRPPSLAARPPPRGESVQPVAQNAEAVTCRAGASGGRTAGAPVPRSGTSGRRTAGGRGQGVTTRAGVGPVGRGGAGGGAKGRGRPLLPSAAAALLGRVR